MVDHVGMEEWGGLDEVGDLCEPSIARRISISDATLPAWQPWLQRSKIGLFVKRATL